MIFRIRIINNIKKDKEIINRINQSYNIRVDWREDIESSKRNKKKKMENA